MATIEYFDAKQLFDEGSAAMFGTGQWDCAEFDENILSLPYSLGMHLHLSIPVIFQSRLLILYY